MTGRVFRPKLITREMVRADRETLFVFGDNMKRRGFGGQAAAMRGEANTIGVPTKWHPGMREKNFFTDEDITHEDVSHAISSAFQSIRQALAAGRNVVIPADGLGAGLAQLPTRAPKIYAWIEAEIAALEGK